jgi:altronate hydrolase
MNAIIINKLDNVAVAIDEIKANSFIEELKLSSVEDIPRGHKVSLRDITEGEDIIKYGSPIGIATKHIVAGSHVHTANLKTNLSEKIDYHYNKKTSPLGKTAGAEFQGYLRTDGSAGVRNEIWIIPTVGCVNGTVSALAAANQDLVRGELEGLYAFPHPFGCSQLGDDHALTKKTLASLAHHPNAAGVLIVGLGCENNTLEDFKKELGDFDEKRILFMSCQEVSDELAEGRKLLSELANLAYGYKREALPVSKLIIGMKCGGSDGLSGVTANPVVGLFSDILISKGGSTILTEVPEMFGAETILMDRCLNEAIFDKSVDMIQDFKDYYVRNGQEIYENPSPGNKAGGISTLEDKSLGCIQKGGTAAVNDVIDTGDRLSVPGLNLLSGPGNDLVSTTLLTAAGAQLILFTTGRGTPFGAPAPTLKISSNSALYDFKQSWIDFDAGAVLSGLGMGEAAENLFELVVKAASGEVKTKSELSNNREIALFKIGVTL